jgi:Rrf2 family protein
MELTRATQFALRAVLDLAVDGPSHTAAIARRRGIPPAQAGKIVQRLVRGGIVQTTRGARGGVRLSRSAGQVTLRQVIESMEGPIVVARCLVWDDCPCPQPCAVRGALGRLQAAVEHLLDEVTLADLAAATRPADQPASGDGAAGPGSAARLPRLTDSEQRTAR